MELYQLKSFLAVARSGSLSRAAVSRHISLPGISKHIKMLEEEFGFPLFTRTPKGMVLTGDGQRVLRHAEQIQHEVDGLSALARRAPAIRVGLNIAPDFLQLYQLQLLLVRHHPDSDITLTNQNSGTLLAGLDKGELDLCLAFGPIPPHLHTLPVHPVEMVLMAPAALPVDLSDLGSQCWIVNTAGCPFKEPLEAFWRLHGITPRTTLLAQDLSRRELVAQGLGIGFLEPQDGLTLIDKGLGRRLGSFVITIPLSVVYRDPAVRALAGLLRNHVRACYEDLPTPAPLRETPCKAPLPVV